MATRHTRLYSSFLLLVHGELLQFLLVAVRELGKVEVAKAAAERVHGCW